MLYKIQYQRDKKHLEHFRPTMSGGQAHKIQSPLQLGESSAYVHRKVERLREYNT